MVSTVTDRIASLTGTLGVKAPCLLATTANITLSGEQTIDGVLTSEDRVLVKNQTTASQNGIYDTSTGTWTRAADFDGDRDIVQGTLINVAQGTQAGLWRLDTAAPVIGTSSLTFSVFPGTSALAVALVDAAGYFTATSVEGALAEGTTRQPTMAALRLVDPVNGHFILREAHTTAGDGGQFLFRGVTGAALGTYTHNNGTTCVKVGGDGSAAWVGVYKPQELTVHTFGAVGDGTTLDDTAFANAAALGATVHLVPGKTYYLSTGVVGVTGTRFKSPAGWSTVKFKTGSGGFNSTDLTADKDAAARCGFLFSSVDDIGMEGIRFTTDGVAERVIYPIRVRGGTATKGCDFLDLYFSGFSALNGGLLSLNSIGVGGYNVENIEAKSCGTALTTWTGTPQITVFEIDNDMVASTPSEPGEFENIRGTDIVFTGAALTLYGQQTDIVNIAGISGTDRKGPVGYGVYGDNVGEVVDLFCSYAVIKGIRFRNAYNYGVKIVHGAQFNDIEIESADSWGQACVVIAGSASLTVHTQYNTVKVGVARQRTTIGSFTTVPVVMFSDNGGGAATCLPKNNTVVVDNAYGDGTNLDYVVRDGGASNANNNYVDVKKATGWATAFCDCPSDNVRVVVANGTEAHLTLGSAQAFATTVEAAVDFSVVVKDSNSEAVTASDKVRCKFPGRKQVYAQVRITGLNSGDVGELSIYKNTTQVASGYKVATGTGQIIPEISKVLYIAENEVSAAGADITIKLVVTSPTGTPVLTQNAALSFFQVTDI